MVPDGGLATSLVPARDTSEDAPPPSEVPGWRHPELAAIVLAGLLLRLPYVLSRASLVYDDGVYYASVGAMRAGGMPFRDVFSSQGPAFLPLVWLGDLVGGRTDWSPRLTPLLAGLALIVIVHRLALRVGDRVSAGIAAALVATSGTAMCTSDRLASDGVAVALGAAAVLAACEPRTRRFVLAAVLLGLGLAVKSIFVVPAGLAVAWLVLRHRGPRATVATGAAALALPVVLSIPWGVSAVWDQYVVLHWHARASTTATTRNLQLVCDVLRGDETLLCWVALVAIVAVVWRWAARRPLPPSSGGPALDVALWLWLVACVLVLRVEHPLFLQHVVILVPPLSLLIARARPPLAAVVAVALLALPLHAHRADWRWSTVRMTSTEQAAVDALATLQPRDGLVISDDPMIAWAARRTSPGSMVDVSYVREDAGDLTVDDVRRAAEGPGVCAVVLWTGRLASLPGLEDRLADYHAVAVAGHEILVRSGCTFAGRP